MKRILTATLLFIWSLSSLAAGSQYIMRVDGLVCPFCAYGIEKKLKEIEGVEAIDVDLDNGLVTVNTATGIDLSEERMKQLFTDSGFTYRSMTKTPQE
ncbi:MAG: heavy-metal-associated domain-containing protein [Gammaproteobacteria bacterium]|nr:heavy-metal-associated domain-containing protein [Gammaproteobacteria bacterium]